MISKFKGWKTLLFSLLTFIVSILQLSDVTALIAPEHLPYVMAFVAIGTAVLRKVTTTPMGTK
jgi:hypothetical protein